MNSKLMFVIFFFLLFFSEIKSIKVLWKNKVNHSHFKCRLRHKYLQRGYLK